MKKNKKEKDESRMEAIKRRLQGSKEGRDKKLIKKINKNNSNTRLDIAGY